MRIMPINLKYQRNLGKVQKAVFIASLNHFAESGRGVGGLLHRLRVRAPDHATR